MPRNETEIKLKVPNTRTIQRRLTDLGFVIVDPRHFERNLLFDFADLRLRRANSILRLRFEGNQSMLTFKGAPVRSRRFKIRREIETNIENGHSLKEILESLGLQQTFCYEKYRTTYAPGSKRDKSRSGVVVYDQTPIGDFLELEGPQRWIDAVAKKLGYSREEYITTSYVALHLKKCSEDGRPLGNMVFSPSNRKQ
jgi:adenylate cyclase class 2